MTAEEALDVIRLGSEGEHIALAERVERLNAMLLESQISNSQLVAEVDNARAAHQSERDDWRADFDRLAEECERLADALMSARNKLAYLSQRLPEVFTHFLTDYAPFSDEGLRPEFASLRKWVNEAFQVLDPLS